MGLVEIWRSALARLHLALTGTRLPEQSHGDARASLLAFVIALAAFGFELGNPGLGVDDYLHLGMEVTWNEFWVGRGMWGGVLLHYLVPGGWIVPFITLLIGIFCQLTTAVVLGWLIGLHRIGVPARALIYSVFVIFPFFSAQMAFSHLQIGYSLASLLCVMGLFGAASCTRSWPRLVVSSVLIAMGFSTYQGCLSVLATAAVAAVSAGLHSRIPLDRHRVARRAGNIGLAIAAGGLLYLLIHKLIIWSAGISPPSDYYSVSWQLAFWERWDLIEPQISFLLLGCGGLVPTGAVLLFLLAAVFAAGDWIVRRPPPVVVAGGLMLGLALVLAPFSVLFLHASRLAPRSSLGAAVVWVVVFAALASSASRTTRWFGNISVSLVVLSFVFQSNQVFYSQNLVAQADRTMIARIAERIDVIDTNPRMEGRPRVVVVGSYSHPHYPGISRYHNSVLGFSNFEWHGGNELRVQALAASVGVDRYDWFAADAVGSPAAVERMLQGRAPWPSADSVFIHDDKIVVWLGLRREPTFDEDPVRSFFARISAGS